MSAQISSRPESFHRPVRVLHDLHWLTRGGLETSLMNLLRYYRNDKIHFDFAVCDHSHYDDEARSLGSTIHKVSHPIHFRRFLAEMRSVMKDGRYDVLHCHRPEHAGVLMRIAEELSVPCRISHARNAGWCRGKKSVLNSLRYWRYLLVSRGQNYRHSTDILAVSSDAGRFFFGEQFTTNRKCRTFFNGLPSEPYDVDRTTERRNAILERFSLSPDSVVIGTVGSLDLQKNQQFLVRVFSILAKRDSRYVLFIAGEGNKRAELENAVETAGLKGRVIMPGVCFDVPELNCQLFDVFCLPSLFEGLPGCVLEAISAGLYAVCADTVTDDLFSNFPERTVALNLNVSPEEWADRLEDGITRRLTPKEGVGIIRQSPFCLEYVAEKLAEIYRKH